MVVGGSPGRGKIGERERKSSVVWTGVIEHRCLNSSPSVYQCEARTTDSLTSLPLVEQNILISIKIFKKSKKNYISINEKQ